ncbi:hypothetical protein R1sor_008329 [Riccia sorocarpa]|uniref:Uncharacterized protein n=1 Tax=Riccia sorocarpa TaxID=122646 RepID=A0ABD3HT93_9MARC
MESPPLSDDTPETSEFSQFFFPLRFEWIPWRVGAGEPGSSGSYHALCLSAVVRMVWYGLARMTYKDTADASPMTPKLLGVVKAFNSSTSKHKLLVIDEANDIPGKFLAAIDQDSLSSQLLSDQSSVEGILVQSRGGMLSRVCTQIGHLLASSSTLEMLVFQLRDIDFRLTDAMAKALSEGLVQTKCLRSLGLVENLMKTQFADVLTSAFTGNVENTSLEVIELPANLERLGMALEVLVSKYKNLKMIRLRFTIHPAFSRATIFQMVAEWDDNFQMVAECLRSRQQSVSYTSEVLVLSFFVDASETLRFSVEEEQRLLSCWRKWLSANDGAFKLKVFQSLHQKRRLKAMVLTCSEDDRSMSNKVFRSLMDLVQANIYLEEVASLITDLVDKDWMVLLQEALRRNKEYTADRQAAI